MPLFDIEVIYTAKYKKRVRAKDEQEAHDKASAMWIDRELKSLKDEDVDYCIFPVAYQQPELTVATTPPRHRRTARRRATRRGDDV